MIYIILGLVSVIMILNICLVVRTQRELAEAIKGFEKEILTLQDHNDRQLKEVIEYIATVMKEKK